MFAVVGLCRRPQTFLIFRRRQRAFCHDIIFRLIAFHRPNLISDNLDTLVRYIHAPLHHNRAVCRQDIRRIIKLTGENHRLEVVYNPESGKKIASEIIEVEDFIGVKSIKAKGKRVTTFAVDAFNWLSPLKPDPEPSDEPEDPEAPESSDPSEIDDRLGYAEGTQTQLF